jgi:hypothetical protein
LKQTSFSWNIDSISDVLGLVIIAGFVVLIVVIAIRSGGLKVGKLRLGGVKAYSAEVGTSPTCLLHTATLKQLQDAIGSILPILRTIEIRLAAQDRVLEAQNQGIDVLLGQLEGEEINGQVGAARRAIQAEKAYYDATNDIVAKGGGQ